MEVSEVRVQQIIDSPSSVILVLPMDNLLSCWKWGRYSATPSVIGLRSTMKLFVTDVKFCQVFETNKSFDRIFVEFVPSCIRYLLYTIEVSWAKDNLLGAFWGDRLLVSFLYRSLRKCWGRVQSAEAAASSGNSTRLLSLGSSERTFLLFQSVRLRHLWEVLRLISSRLFNEASLSTVF